MAYPINLNQRIQIDEYILQLQMKEKNYVRYQLKKEVFIGRDANNDLTILNSNVSKCHTRIYYSDGWYIEDLNSKNGIYVNYQKVNQIKLEVGDLVSVVGYDFYFCAIFLLVPQSILSHLSLFNDIISAKNKVLEKEILFIENIEKPELVLPTKNQSTLRTYDLVNIFVYIFFFMHARQYSYFILINIINLFIRVSDNVSLYFKKRKLVKNYQNKVEEYHLYLNRKYPNVEKLINYNLLGCYDSYDVRIGTYDGHVLLHNFKASPSLLIVGEYERCKNMLVQIIYQFLRFYPDVSVKTALTIKELLFLDNQNVGKKTTLGIQQIGDFSIYLEKNINQSHIVFDAIINVDEEWYFDGYKYRVELDKMAHPYLISDLYTNSTQGFTTFSMVMGLHLRSIEQLRLQIKGSSALKGVLGYQNNTVEFLDLHEQRQGPHLLVVGMSGSGKSEWLSSYLLSLSVYYDSDDLQFFVIDFKGGLLCKMFEELYHTCMVLSNLQSYQIHRAIAALEDELLFRQNLLLSISGELNLLVSDIHHLKKLYREGKTKHNLAHLVIVVDEFAELKMSYPEMMNSLIRISRTGRSLGIHLILSTQRASGIVDRQIESNIQTIICFKVANQQDSFDVLGNKNAFLLHNVGDLICKSGKEEIKSRTIFLENERILKFYNLNKILQFQFSVNNNQTSNKKALVHQINIESKKCRPLYVKNFCEVPIDSFGIYDDYKNRKIGRFEKQDIGCIIGGKYEIAGVENKNLRDRINPQDLLGDLGLIFFDIQFFYNLTMKKVNFEVDKEKELGILYLKGEIYQCRIISSAI